MYLPDNSTLRATSATQLPFEQLSDEARRANILLEESARSYNEPRIRPLTYVSVDRAYQAESVGSNFSVVSLIYLFVALRFMSEKHVGKSPLPGRSASTSQNGFLAQIWLATI